MANESNGLTDVVNAPADKIIEALTDFDTFTDWQVSVLECEVLERDGDGRGSLIRMKVDAKIRKMDYIVRYSYDLPTSLSWDQVSGDLKENTGRYTFTPREDGGTDVTVDIVAEVGFFVPGPMKNLIRDQSLKNSMRELKKRVEVS
ncbi:MAG: SRPBCC family protein [Actinomycetota bacterium]|nr:SRPBCC family protein [Actinomycetota bacterium]